jgi:hypothetical protein
VHDIMCVYVCVCTILRFVRKCACIHSVGAMPLGRANLYMCARTYRDQNMARRVTNMVERGKPSKER